MKMLAIVILAVLVEAIMEWLGRDVPHRIKPYVAAALAVVVCLVYRADLPAALGLSAPIWWAGPIVTGLVIGRGSNYLAIVLKRLQIVSAPAQAATSVPTEEPRG